MGRKRGSRNAGAGTVAATAQGNAAAETVQEAVSTGAQDAASDTAGNQQAGDRPVAEAAAAGGDGPGNQLGDISGAVGGAVDGTENATAAPDSGETDEVSQDPQDAAGEAGQEAAAQPQQAGPAQEAEVLIDIAMAGVGHSLMERIEAYGQQWPLKDWTPAEDPAEVVSDLVCMLQELPITEIEAEREKLGLDPAGYVPQDCTSATPVPTIDGTSRVELLARRCARAAREFAGGVGAGQLFDREEAEIMADFVRDNPDAPVLAMFNHLTLKKRYPRTIPNRADEFMLSLFHAACLAAHRFEDDQAAEEAARANKPAPAASWPGEKAMKPADPPFAATGFSPR